MKLAVWRTEMWEKGERRKKNKQKSCVTELHMKDVKQNLLFSTTSSA